jgi:Gas vesicle synthesis protein GvpO
MAQLGELTGHDVEGVISVERNDDGWQIGVEVVESHRIPDSADILATYEVGLDEDAELMSYRRTERYSRGQTVGRSR